MASTFKYIVNKAMAKNQLKKVGENKDNIAPSTLINRLCSSFPEDEYSHYENMPI